MLSAASGRATYGTLAGNGGGSGTLSVDQQGEFISAINTYRQLHGSVPVTWDDDLATRAQSYADTCPCGYSDVREDSRSPDEGETLMWGNHMNPQSVVNGWTDEASDYDSYANGGTTAGSRGWERFVQVVWKPTLKVGCGYTTGCPTPGEPLIPNTWVCRWDVKPSGGAAGRITHVGPGNSGVNLLALTQHNSSMSLHPRRPNTARTVRHGDRREAVIKASRASASNSRVLAPARESTA